MTSDPSCTTIAGVAVRIRPIRITDMDMEAEFIAGLSPQTRHYRFLGGVKALSPKDLRKHCDVDGHRSMAFVATVEEAGREVEVGVCRYAPNASEDVREIAVTIADEWQHKGLAAALMEKLIESAKDNGVHQLYSVDLADNRAMRTLAKELGMSRQQDPDDPRQVIYSLSL